MIEAAMIWNEPNNKSHWDLEIDPEWTRYADCVIRAGTAIADVNPANFVMEGARQGFIGGVDWTHTWQAIVAVLGLLLVLGALAVRSMRRVGVNA